jgi:HK97 gp10 family phage protein
MVKIVGTQVVKARLRRLAGAEAVQEVGKALFVAGNRIQTTHGLDRQIETEAVGPLKVRVTSNAPYSAFLEFGTSRMAARPFMMPAAEKERAAVTTLVREAVNRVIKGTSSRR